MCIKLFISKVTFYRLHTVLLIIKMCKYHSEVVRITSRLMFKLH